MSKARCIPAEYADVGPFDRGYAPGFEITYGNGFDDGFDDGFNVIKAPSFTTDYDNSFESLGIPRIVDIGVIRDDLFMLVETPEGYCIEKLSIPLESPDIRNATWIGSSIASIDTGSYTGITDGSFMITIDGLTRSIEGIDLSIIGSIDDIASTIEAGIQAMFGPAQTCKVWNNRFVIKSESQLATSTVSAPIAAAAGTNLATAALMGTPGTSHSPEMPYPVLMDAKREVQGVYEPTLNRTSWNYGLDDCSVDMVVLGRDFGGAAGSEIPTTRTSPRILVAPGDWTSGLCYVGRGYRMRIRLSRPHVRDANGTVILDGRMTIRNLNIEHKDTVTYTLNIDHKGRTLRSEVVSNLQAGVSTIGEFSKLDGTREFRAIGNADEVTVDLVSDSPLPCTFPQMEYISDYTRRSP